MKKLKAKDGQKVDIYSKPVRDGNISDLLSELGIDSSYANRQQIAKRLNIPNYSGTAEQNISMFKMLKDTPVSNTMPQSYSPTAPSTKAMSNSDAVIKGYIDQMVSSGNKKIFLTDKGTKTTYYGDAKDYKGNIDNLKKFQVLTGVNDDPYSYQYDTMDPEAIDKSGDPSKHKVTPVGRFAVSPNPNIYGTPGVNINGMSVAYHTVYPGELKQRMAKLQDNNIDNNNVSYGCVNCNKPDAEALSKYISKGDSTYIIDSRLPAQVLTKAMTPAGKPTAKVAPKVAPKKDSSFIQGLVDKASSFFGNFFEEGGYAVDGYNIPKADTPAESSGVHTALPFITNTFIPPVSNSVAEMARLRGLVPPVSNSRIYKSEEENPLVKTGEVLSNPFTAVRSYIKTGYIPDHFNKGNNFISPLDVVPITAEALFEKGGYVGCDSCKHKAAFGASGEWIPDPVPGQNYNAIGQPIVNNQGAFVKGQGALQTPQVDQTMEPITPIGTQKLTLPQVNYQDAIPKDFKQSPTELTQGMDPGKIMGIAGDAALGVVDTFAALGNKDKPFNAAMTGGSSAVKATKNILAPIDAIPGAKLFTAPIKALSFGIGAIVAAAKKNIDNAEEGKAKDYRDYLDRNLQSVTGTRGYGKYGITISSKSLEDEIHADFDNYLLNSK